MGVGSSNEMSGGSRMNIARRRRHDRVWYVLASLSLASCQFGDRWDAWVYPDGENLNESVTLHGFTSFKQCQAAAINEIRKLDAPDSADFECGKNCKWRETWRINVCEVTRS